MEISEKITELVENIEEFKAAYNARIYALETAAGRTIPGGGPSSGSSTQKAAYDDKFYAWARRGADPDGVRALEVQAGMSTLSDPDGGFLVPEQVDRELDRLATDDLAMRRICTVKTGLRGDYKRPFSKGGASGGWVGEKDARAETDTPEIHLFAPAWAEVYALPKITQKLLDEPDFDVAAWLLEELNTVEAEMEGKAFISGNGVKQPKGLLAYPTVANASWVFGKLGFITSGGAETLADADKLIDLQHAVKPVYRRNAAWLMNDATAAVIRKMKDGDGNYIWRSGLLAGDPDTLLGKPVEIDDNMPAVGADAFPIAFGDFKRGYLIGDHAVGRRLLRDPYTEKAFVKFYQYKRVFGGVVNFEAIKLLKISA